MQDISPDECELIGIILGDGNIYTIGNKYVVGITGNKADTEYFTHIQKMIFSIWGKQTTPFVSSGALRIRFNSKPVVLRLINFFGIPAGKGKCEKIRIPEIIAQDWNKAKHLIRGFTDTDGSVFTANKPGSPNYPSIEITTTSKTIAGQINYLLAINGFKPANVRQYKQKQFRVVYKVALNGRKNLHAWLGEIGFSNPRKLQTAKKALGIIF